MLNEDKRYYFPLLILFLCLNDTFDTYATNYPNVIGSFIESEFSLTHSTFLLIMGIASAGMYFVFVNQYLSDLFGRRVMMAVIMVGIGISSIIISTSMNPIQYTIGVFLLYIFFSSDIWVIFLSEQSSEKHRAKYISLVLIFGAIGGAFTIPLFRSILLPVYSWRSMMWFAYIAIPIGFLAFIFKESKAYRKMLTERIDRQEKQKLGDLKKVTKIFNKKIYKSTIVISLFGFFVGFNYVFNISGEPYLKIDRGLSDSQVNLVITLLALGAILGYLISGILSDYMGRKPTLYLFSALFPVGMLLVIFGDFILILVGGFISSISYWSLFTTSRMVSLEIFPTDIRGAGAGFRNLCYAIGTTTGSFFTSFILKYIGLGFSFLLNSIFLVIMIPLIFLFIKETKGIKLDFTELL